MYCKMCGAETPDGIKICSSCSKDSYPVPVEKKETVIPNTPPEKEPEKNMFCMKCGAKTPYGITICSSCSKDSHPTPAEKKEPVAPNNPSVKDEEAIPTPSIPLVKDSHRVRVKKKETANPNNSPRNEKKAVVVHSTPPAKEEIVTPPTTPVKKSKKKIALIIVLVVVLCGLFSAVFSWIFIGYLTGASKEDVSLGNIESQDPTTPAPATTPEPAVTPEPTSEPTPAPTPVSTLTLTSYWPKQNATDYVPAYDYCTAAFSQDLDPSRCPAAYMQNLTTGETYTLRTQRGATEYRCLLILFDGLLKDGCEYVVTVPANSVYGTDGSVYANELKYTFSTPKPAPIPNPSSTLKLNGYWPKPNTANYVPNFDYCTAEFSQDIDPNRCPAAHMQNLTTGETYSLSTQRGATEYKCLLILFNGLLKDGCKYVVTIPANSVYGTDGSVYANEITFTFSTPGC